MTHDIGGTGVARGSAARPMKLVLHVGHGKTGSSFLQSAIANSLDVLSSFGILYPIEARVAEKARRGGITSGNMAVSREAFHAVLDQGARSPHDVLLISNETLFNRMKAEGVLADLQKCLPGCDLHVLLYLRDPLEHAVSNYHQMVKRAGFTGSFEDMLAGYTVPWQVGDFLSWLKAEAPGARVDIFNYSRHRKALLKTLEEALGIPEGALVAPRVTRVNRSMTLSELALQIAINRHFQGRNMGFLSDALCERLPNIQTELPPASREAIALFLNRMKKMIERHNLQQVIPAAEFYHLEDPAEAAERFSASAPQSYTFSSDQLDVIASVVSRQIRKAEKA